MVCRLALGATVIARDDGASVAVLARHGLGQDRVGPVVELRLHVDAALVADGAPVRRLHVGVEAAPVDAVAAPHKDDRLGRREEIVPADGAVAIDRPLDALVAALDRDACLAFLAVEKVLPEADADPAQAAVVTVVDGLVRVVAPELAHVAKVRGGWLLAADTRVRGALRAPTEHAQHVLGLLSR